MLGPQALGHRQGLLGQVFLTAPQAAKIVEIALNCAKIAKIVH